MNTPKIDAGDIKARSLVHAAIADIKAIIASDDAELLQLTAHAARFLQQLLIAHRKFERASKTAAKK